MCLVEADQHHEPEREFLDPEDLRDRHLTGQRRTFVWVIAVFILLVVLVMLWRLGSDDLNQHEPRIESYYELPTADFQHPPSRRP